ncbi:MAG: ABC transporter permease [Muribaculaceae bacterium]|nr:ABC transporter permease [Muribaculaceae bacterium]
MRTTIFDPENWREIVATLSRNKTRTFLTAFGIFWGTFMLALLWGGAVGFQGIMSRQFAGIATNMGGVNSDMRSISYRGFNKGSSWGMTEQDIEAIRRTAPYIEQSTTLNFNHLTAVNADHSKSAGVLGVESQYNGINNPIIYEGRFLNESDVAGVRKVAVIGRNLANELFPGESPVGRDVSLGGIHFTIVGMAGQLGEASIGGRVDDSFIIPATTMRRAFNQGTTVHFFIYTAPAGHKPSENQAAIRRVLSSAHTIHPDDERAIQFMDISEMFEMVSALFMGFTLLAIFVGGSSLIAGVIGVGNIMWIIVKERTGEFGIRRAIGARPADITMQVLSESVLLTLVAGTAGICFACLVLGIADHMTAEPPYPPAGFQISFAKAVGILVSFIVLGSAAGTLPAVKAMRIKPVEAMRSK